MENNMTNFSRITSHNMAERHECSVGACNSATAILSAESGSERRRSSVRVFKKVESLTNRLVATDKNFQAIYDVLMIQLIMFVFYVLYRDSLRAGHLFLDLSLLYHGLGFTSIFFAVEMYLLLSVMMVHPCFKAWKFCYTIFLPRLFSGSLFLGLYAFYVLSSCVIVCWISLSLPLPQLTTLILLVEQLRLCMKSYSFVRENAYKVLYPWKKDDETGPAVWYAGQMSPQVGSFSQYLYFLFAPTLLYRDHYPRNEGPIQWHNVAVYFLQFVTTIWFLAILGKEFTFPSSLSLVGLINCYLNTLLCAFLGYILIHTCVFHGYLNLVSELLKFADREFYQDWWTSTSFSSYYRKWNTLVHDWIHSYLYNDMKHVFKSQLAAVFVTILLSAFIHEYLLAVVLRFASPILLLEFAGLGAMFYLMRPFHKRRISNLFVLLALGIGGANLIFYYQVELASRLYCPRQLTPGTFFKPRMFECYYEYQSLNQTVIS